MIQKLSLSSKVKRNLAFISILSFGALYEGSVGQAYAAPIQPVFTKISQFHADINMSNHPTRPHPLIHALGKLLGIKPSSAGTTTSAISHATAGSKSTSAIGIGSNPHTITNLNTTSVANAPSAAAASQNISSSKPPTFHRWLSILSHFYHEITGPTSFSPSPQTLANSAGKTPVILVHGTWANGNIMHDMYDSLDKAGIPTYVSTFGTGGNSLLGMLPTMGEVAPAAQAEKELSDYIDKVQKETGASKVDLVGHSQGGLLIKDYIAHDDKDNVQAVVDLGATNHGTTMSGSSKLLNLFPKPIKNLLVKGLSSIIGQGATDQLPDSEYIQNLNKSPDTKAGIHYLVLSTKNDLISTPYQNTYLKAVPGADVTNMEVHSIPGVTGFVGHNMYPFFPGIVNKVTQFIQEKGEPGVKSFATPSGDAASTVSDTASAAGSTVAPAVNTQTATPPAVSLLG